MINIEVVAETTEAHNAKVIEIADTVATAIGRGPALRCERIDDAIEYLHTQGFVITAP